MVSEQHSRQLYVEAASVSKDKFAFSLDIVRLLPLLAPSASSRAADCTCLSVEDFLWTLRLFASACTSHYLVDTAQLAVDIS